MKSWYDTIRFALVFVILFIVQILFNCFIYKTDGISVLFGICYLTFAIVIHYNIKIIFEKIYYKRQTKKIQKNVR